jgi:ERCC4 domain-containing protein
MIYDICQICGENVIDQKHFWRTHKLSLADYYQKYFRKKDLYSGEVIPFVSKEQYFSTDFLNRTNLKHYVESLTKDAAMAYCKNQLKIRKELKNLVYTPTQTELRSLILPSIITYTKLFGSYSKLCEELGFINKFEDVSDFPKKLNINIGKDYIFVDSREQHPLTFDYNYEIKGLNFGDYQLSTNNKIAIERKSLGDFLSTLSTGYERLIKEIERAKGSNSYLFILVEESVSKSLSFDYSRWYNKFTRASSNFIFHRVRELLQKYPNIQISFAGNREKLKDLVQKILLNQEIFIKFDVQLLLDLKMV